MEELLDFTTTTGVTQSVHIKKQLLMEIFGSAWTAAKVVLVLCTFYLIVYTAQTYHGNLPIPVKMADVTTAGSPGNTILTKALDHLKCPQDKRNAITEGVLKGAATIGVDPILILALLYTESNFNLRAVSPKGYRGLMQTPSATMAYADVDILHGARILEEKMKSPAAKGVNGKVDMRKALAMYKGGLNPAAFRYADETLALHRKLTSI